MYAGLGVGSSFFCSSRGDEGLHELWVCIFLMSKVNLIEPEFVFFFLEKFFLVLNDVFFGPIQMFVRGAFGCLRIDSRNEPDLFGFKFFFLSLL